MELLRIFGMNFKKLMRNKRLAFTLAEVVVVMAILGIMMAAFAPVVTKRTLSAGGNNKITFDVMKDHNGIYFGTTGDQKPVVIGDNEIDSSGGTVEFDPKMFIISNNNFADGTSDRVTPQIGFGSKIGANTMTYTGQILLDPSFDATNKEDKGNLIFGGVYNSNYRINSTSFYGNTIIGMNAGPDPADTASTTKNLTAIGTKACEGNTGENVICIGSLSGKETNDANPNYIYIGNRNIAYDADHIIFGQPTNTLTTLIQSAASPFSLLPSDIRLKNVGKEFTGGIDELNQLTFYNFTYKRDADKTPRVGVMAQDLQKVFPDAVSQNDDGYLYIRKDDMFYAALNAIKDLFKKMTDNSEKIKALEERNAVLETQVKELQDLYIDLAKKVDKKAAKKKLTITPEKPVEVEAEAVPEENSEQPVQE